MWVDAFTGKRFGGNPCAVVFDADQLSSSDMLQVAKEMNLSETAFVLKSNESDFAARYFTPAEEIPLAGHPTISTIYSLVQQNYLDERPQTVTLKLPAGIINVDVICDGGKANKFVMTQLKPKFLRTHDRMAVAKLFNLNVTDLLETPIRTVSTGTPQLMIPVKSHDSLKRAKMNVGAYTDYKSRSDFFSSHIFCANGISPEGATFARHLGVPPDTLEDPFTGSATGGMAAYLWHYGLIQKPNFVAEQGHWMGRPGSADVEVVGPPDNISAVRVGGCAVAILEGEIVI